MHLDGERIAPDTVRFERTLPGPIERVWAYLTEADKRARWLAGGEMELRVGGRVRLEFQHADLSPQAAAVPERFAALEQGHEMLGTVTACTPPSLLAFTWHEDSDHDSEVTFELDEAAGGTVRLVVTQRRLGEDVAVLANVAAGWHTHLTILAERLAGRTPRPFFAAFEATEARYRERFTGS